MQNNFKRVLSVLFAVVVLFSSIPMTQIVGTEIANPLAIVSEAASKKTHLKKTKITLTTGETYTQKLLNKKGKAIDASKVTWKSKNKKIAKVGKSGKVTAVKAGKTTITAKYKGKTYKFTVTVKNAKFLDKKIAIYIGKTGRQKLIDAKGDNISSDEISWKSSNKKVATVSDSGKVKGKKEGTVKISATYKNKTYKYTLTVMPKHTHSYYSATCTSPKRCSCGVTAGIALGHSYSSSTCTSPEICYRCGVVKGRALGHNYSLATCVSPMRCLRCGVTSGSTLGHNYINNNCSRCGKVDPDSLPVGLEKLHIIDSSYNYKYQSSSFQDTFGNTYVGAHLFGHGFSGNSYAIYNLNQKYKTFSASIVASPKLENCAYADYFIYVDDVLVYSLTLQEKTTPKKDIEINVQGATTLKIEAIAYRKPGSAASGYMGQGCIVNAYLYK